MSDTLKGKLSSRGGLGGSIRMGTPGSSTKDYEELINKPRINGIELIGDLTSEDLGITDTENNYTDEDKAKVDNLGTASTYDVPESGDADENEVVVGTDSRLTNARTPTSHTHTVSEISDFPTLGTAASKNVPTSGNASNSEVVMGNDTRLSDNRPASDVYPWAKEATKPSYDSTEIAGLGTAAVADATNAVTEDSSDLVTSGAVYTAIKSLPTPMVMKGTLGVNGTITSLPTPSEDNVGFTYKVITAGTYAGQDAKIGDFYSCCKPEGEVSYQWMWFPSGDETFTDTWRGIKVNGTEKLNNAINGGDIDFVDGNNTSVSFNGSGNQIAINVPNVSNSSAGVAPKGASVSSQDQTTKFLREDGTWQAPSYTNSKSQVGLGNVDNTSDATKKTNFTGSIASGNTNFVTGGDAYTALNNKVDKVSGKELSTNDYTTTEKNKLAGIATNATKVESSETNGNIKINGTETQVYDDSDIQDVITEDTTTVTGNPLSFNTLSAQRASQAEILLNPIQDLHGYDKPWVGGAGKNKLNYNIWKNVGAYQGTAVWENNGVTLTPNEGVNAFTQYGVSRFGDATLSVSEGDVIRLSWEEDTNKSGENYIFAHYNGADIASVHINNSNAKYLVYTVPSGVNQITFRMGASNGVGSISYKNIMLQKNTSVVTYEPYENLCPISGRSEIGIDGCGKNIWDEEWENGKINQDTGADVSDNNCIRNKGFIDVRGLSSLYASFSRPSGVNVRMVVHFYDANKNYLPPRLILNGSNNNFDIPNNASYIHFYMTDEYGATYNNNISVNYPSTDTSYHDYEESNSLTIQFGETVYGGSLDVEKGVLMVDKKLVDMSSLSWINDITQQGYQRFRTENQISDAVAPQESTNLILCSCLEVNRNPITQTSGNGIILYTTKYIYARYEQVDNLTDFISAITGQTICYTLANPITINLTPHQISLLKGVNNISVSDDYSTITLTYRSGEVATLGDLLETENKMLAKQHVYSTDEQIVGTWIDGSKIYERTFEIEATQLSNQGTSLNIDTSGMQYIIYGAAHRTTGNTGTSALMIRKHTNNTLMVYVCAGTTFDNVNLITVQYTKSTD